MNTRLTEILNMLKPGCYVTAKELAKRLGVSISGLLLRKWTVWEEWRLIWIGSLDFMKPIECGLKRFIWNRIKIAGLPMGKLI